MRRLLLPLAAFFIAPPALAAEPSGCDKFAWPLEKEQRLLGEARQAPLGAALDRAAGSAAKIELQPFEAAKLPYAVERKPRNSPSWAGFMQFGEAAAGLYKISLSEGAWIDVVQDAHKLEPVAFTGATDCPHIRKSVKFELGPSSFTLQVSDAASASIAIVITPAE
jgi:hypothetical protein